MFAVEYLLTVILLFINIKNSFTYMLIKIYVILLIFTFFYFILLVILNIRKLKWIDLKKALKKFIITFVSTAILFHIVRYGFKLSQIELFAEFAGILCSAITYSYFQN